MVDLLVYTNHRMGDMYYNKKVTLLTLNGTNYWVKAGLTVQKPTLIISNHNYH